VHSALIFRVDALCLAHRLTLGEGQSIMCTGALEGGQSGRSPSSTTRAGVRSLTTSMPVEDGRQRSNRDTSESPPMMCACPRSREGRQPPRAYPPQIGDLRRGRHPAPEHVRACCRASEKRNALTRPISTVTLCVASGSTTSTEPPGRVHHESVAAGSRADPLAEYPPLPGTRQELSGDTPPICDMLGHAMTWPRPPRQCRSRTSP